MPSISKARFDALVRLETTFNAQGAKLEACVNDLGMRLRQALNDLDGANARCSALEAQLSEVAATHADTRRIVDRAALMRRAKQLAADGVPCVMRGNYVLHAKTGAILAQVSS